MSEQMTWAAQTGGFAIHAAVNERMGFIRRTYAHLLGMLVGIAGVATVTVQTGLMEKAGIPILIAGVIGVIFVVPRMLMQRVSRSRQYVAAGICTAFYGVMVGALAQMVFLRMGSYAILGQSFILTSCVFGGLTAYVFMTKKDFSFIGGLLSAGVFVLFGLLIVSMFFGAAGHLLFSGFAVLLLAGFVLYDTSNVMNRFATEDHVVASTMLMIDFVMMFWYITMLLMSSRD